MRSSNPALSENTFSQWAGTGGYAGGRADTMTIDGTAQKALILLGLAALTGGYTWSQLLGPNSNPAMIMPMLIGSLIVSLIASLFAIFNPKSSPISAPIYAAAEGVLLGAVSAFANARFPGVVPQAVGLTFGTLGALLIAYQAGVIRATEPFKRGIVAATGAVAIVYLVNIVLSLFGMKVPFLHEANPIGIGISLIVVVIAALNFVLDFDFIEQGARANAPKFMEWYGAFGLMLTLVWLYFEILRLLQLLRSFSDD